MNETVDLMTFVMHDYYSNFNGYSPRDYHTLRIRETLDFCYLRLCRFFFHHEFQFLFFVDLLHAC